MLHGHRLVIVEQVLLGIVGIAMGGDKVDRHVLLHDIRQEAIDPIRGRSSRTSDP
jgi:hypothetical protein